MTFPTFLLQLVFASNWFGRLPLTFNGSVWSVSVEVLAYAFFFLMVRFFRPGLVLCLVVAVVFKALDHFQPQNLFVCIEYFFVGGAVVRLIEKLNRTQSRIAFWLCVAGIVAIGATRLGSGTVIVFAFCCLTAFALLNEASGLRFEQMSKLGDLTYASYLIHFPIQLPLVLLLDRLGVSRGIFFSRLALSTFIAVTFGLSWPIFTASRWRRRGEFVRSRCHVCRVPGPRAGNLGRPRGIASVQRASLAVPRRR